MKKDTTVVALCLETVYPFLPVQSFFNIISTNPLLGEDREKLYPITDDEVDINNDSDNDASNSKDHVQMF